MMVECVVQGAAGIKAPALDVTLGLFVTPPATHLHRRADEEVPTILGEDDFVHEALHHDRIGEWFAGAGEPHAEVVIVGGRHQLFAIRTEVEAIIDAIRDAKHQSLACSRARVARIWQSFT